MLPRAWSPRTCFSLLSVLSEIVNRIYSSCDSQIEQPKEQRFSPYENNGGWGMLSLFYNFSILKFGCSTCLAVAGDDFCIVAADSRLSVGYSILSRTTPKASQLTQHCVIASSGCNSDQVLMEPLPTCLSVLNSSLQVALHKLLKFKMKM